MRIAEKPTPLSERPEDSSSPVGDAIIPAYNERADALVATIAACLKQSRPINRIYVVDDGSPEPVVLPEWARDSSQIVLLRLSKNQGVAAARNAAISLSTASFLACVNAEVLPDPDWLATCTDYLVRHPRVGACYTRTVPDKTDRLLTQWRMRFQEPRFSDQSGPAEFAHGHAAFFRRSAFDAVGGYDVTVGSVEDADICERMWKIGWETHYIAESRSISIQEDTLKLLAKKQLRDIRWTSPESNSLAMVYASVTKWTIIRAGRNVVKGRFSFLPIDIGLWAYALWIATVRTVKHIFARH
ncbi:MAG TPA: glycosyltransferase family 2 protein [Candidatus Acidoferrum sp.]